MTDLVMDNAFLDQDSYAGSSPFDFSSPGSSASSSDLQHLPLSPSPTPSQDSVVIKKEDDTKEANKKEEKPVKKRKSWGQQLPTPTTCLPPRKRAKTQAEKEQRRVERVLRNRAAAQKSREVKKQQLERIELERDELKTQNAELIKTNELFQSLLREHGIDFTAALLNIETTTTTTPKSEPLRPSPESDIGTDIGTPMFGFGDELSDKPDLSKATLDPQSLFYDFAGADSTLITDPSEIQQPAVSTGDPVLSDDYRGLSGDSNDFVLRDMPTFGWDDADSALASSPECLDFDELETEDSEFATFIDCDEPAIRD